jgi:hypothetical protein
VQGQRTHTWRLLAMLTVTVWLDAVLNGPRSGAGTVHRLPAGAAAQVLQAAAAPPI